MTDSTPTSELVAIVREGLNPRGHHRLCRINIPTEFSSDCNCPYEENEREHAALDRLEEQYQALHSRVDEELRLLERWAGEQNAGNAFAEQVRFWALSRLEKLERSNPATNLGTSPAEESGRTEPDPASRQDA